MIGHPWELAQRGHHFKGPMLLGTSRYEGVSFVGVPGNFSKPDFEAWSQLAMPQVPGGLPTLMSLYGCPGKKCHNATSGCSVWWCSDGVVNHSSYYWAAAKLTGDSAFHCGSRYGAHCGQDVFLHSFTPAHDLIPVKIGSIGHCAETNNIYLHTTLKNRASRRTRWARTGTASRSTATRTSSAGRDRRSGPSTRPEHRL